MIGCCCLLNFLILRNYLAVNSLLMLAVLMMGPIVIVLCTVLLHTVSCSSTVLVIMCGVTHHMMIQFLSSSITCLANKLHQTQHLLCSCCRSGQVHLGNLFFMACSCCMS